VAAPKDPGEYRRVSNGSVRRSTIEEARFIPCGADRLPDAMTAWEKLSARRRAGCSDPSRDHSCEFEAIHPFLDGNGRLGRLVNPAVIVQPRNALPAELLSQRISG